MIVTGFSTHGFYNKAFHHSDRTIQSKVNWSHHDVDNSIILSSFTDINAEVIDEENEDSDEEYEWMPDRERAKMARELSMKRAEAAPPTPKATKSNKVLGVFDSEDDEDLESAQSNKQKRLVYTDEEEELISILGGKDLSNPSPKRESGFMGDSTLKEIAMDFQVPICYLADVLCGWGVPPPINPSTLLGDMVTGEQAFAVLEAIHTLDVGSLNDRYADYDLETLCWEYDIELSAGFELAITEGWNLPFGVKTFLRVEQEEHLIDKLTTDVW